MKKRDKTTFKNIYNTEWILKKNKWLFEFFFATNKDEIKTSQNHILFGLAYKKKTIMKKNI